MIRGALEHRTRTEFHPESMRFTSDRVALEGFRVVVRKMANEGETSSGRRGIPVFGFACCAVQGKGRACFTFQNDPKTKVIENQISMLIPPNQPFHVSWRQAAGMVGTFEIHPRFFEEVLRGAGLSASRFRSMPPLRFVMDRGVHSLSQLLMHETEEGCPSGREYFGHLATALVITLGMQMEVRLPVALDAQECRIQQAVVFMEANFTSKLSLQEAARASGLSAFHFSRLFHRIVGLSPHQYLLRYRIQHAHKLLSKLDDGPSIAQVAAECGFADQSHFGRHFRRAYGVSPSEFRRAQEKSKHSRKNVLSN